MVCDGVANPFGQDQCAGIEDHKFQSLASHIDLVFSVYLLIGEFPEAGIDPFRRPLTNQEITTALRHQADELLFQSGFSRSANRDLFSTTLTPGNAMLAKGTYGALGLPWRA